MIASTYTANSATLAGTASEGSGKPPNAVGFAGKAQAGMGVAGGGGGPHDPGMQGRVTRSEDQFSRIEALLQRVDDSVRKLGIDAGELKGRIAGLPSTWAMIAAVPGSPVALTGLPFAALKLSGMRQPAIPNRPPARP